MAPSRPDVPATPRLEQLLLRLRRRLLRQLWLYGIGTVLGAVVLWLIFAFLADWGLRVPRPIRVFHGLALVGIALVFLIRDGIRPLRRFPDREGLALLLERVHPELRELLISAVQFQRDPEGSDGDPALRRKVIEEAERRASEISVDDVVDREAPRARFLLGVGGAAFLTAAAFLHPLHARIFFDRMLGGDSSWPQRTRLVVEIPGLSDALVEGSPERLAYRVARGTDIPILITAEGDVPDEVTLHFENGRDKVLTPTGSHAFRTLLSSCQEDTHFYATGGDDTDGLPRVEIEVLQPPDIEGLAVAVDPPPYSGLDASLVFDRDVEVLRGSRVAIRVLPAPLEARGIARILPTSEEVPLHPADFPVPPETAADSAPRRGLGFERTADESFGYRIELVDASGLSNPDPGLFRVRVVEDRVPEVQVLAPARTEFEIVKGGAIPLRARAEDDFGLVEMVWSVRPFAPGEETEPLLHGSFALRHLEPTVASEADEGGTRTLRHRALGAVRLEVDDLGTEAVPVVADQRYLLQISARDNREPQPGVGHALPIRARVVTPEELLRRMQDRLGQARLQAVRLADLQREKRARVEELLDSLEGDETLEGGDSLVLAEALSGQRRVESEARDLARDLAAVAEDVLYARLDEKADALLEFYDRRASQESDLRFQGQVWREMAEELAQGHLGTPGFAANLSRLVALALEVAEVHEREAVGHLAEAERAIEPAEVQAALIAAAETQTRALERLEELLDQLAEWDNFQNILALTRDIRNRQKALRERTQQFASQK